MALPRDSQRTKVYKAEDSALIPLRRPLDGIDEAIELAHRTMLRAGIRSRYGYAANSVSWPVNITASKGGRSWGGRESIALGKHAGFTDHILLHELAHTIHARITAMVKRQLRFGKNLYGTRTIELAGGAAHGWQFCQVYLDLVWFGMGRDAYEALKASFKRDKVKWHKPKELTPEQRQQLAARLRSIRTTAPVIDDQDWPVPNEWTWQWKQKSQ